jgi:hypothetical protein
VASEEKRPIGLKAVKQARAERARSKTGRVSGKTWLAAGAAMVLVMGAAYAFSGRTLGKAREDLLSQQRAALVTVGKEWFPLREKIEKITLDEARGGFKGELVDPEAKTWDFRSVPGIYLRLRVADARDEKTLRDKARDSVKDSFTGCLLRETNAPLARGEPDAGTFPEQPWNLRQAYTSTRVLTPEWVDEVNAASDDLRLRVFQQQYAKAKTTEIPLAIDIVKRAQFYLLVLDEDVPEAKEFAGDSGTITEEALQQVAHPARIVIVNLKSGALLVRLQKSAEAGFVFAGEHAVFDPEIRAAMRRQVNNCALAQEAWAAIRPAKQAHSADAGAPSP